ncbi:uncharacterized protein [Drosophila suzukii]|uniref:Uncharacterized protein n=1 Tax=Drosophila suzukii TaxID=28584 RepID=A0ABM4TNS8_DROSZ
MSGRRYVRPNKLQGNCVTCRNFHSALSNAIRNRWTCCNINLTFYGPGLGSSAMRYGRAEEYLSICISVGGLLNNLAPDRRTTQDKN